MREKKTVLLVEDNEHLNEINRRALTRAGYRVLTALTLSEARRHLLLGAPDVIILDIMLPDGDGVDFCREIRQQIAAPILFLTSVSGYEQTLEGLIAGGDDYLNKPFDLNILLAKVAAFLRRDEIAKRKRSIPDKLSRGPLTLDIVAQKAFLKGNDMQLTPKDFSLLLLLIQHENEAIPAETLYETMWRQSMAGDNRAVKTAVSRLRKKLEFSGYSITAVRGQGYRFGKEE